MEKKISQKNQEKKISEKNQEKNSEFFWDIFRWIHTQLLGPIYVKKEY